MPSNPVLCLAWRRLINLIVSLIVFISVDYVLFSRSVPNL